MARNRIFPLFCPYKLADLSVARSHGVLRTFVGISPTWKNLSEPSCSNIDLLRQSGVSSMCLPGAINLIEQIGVNFLEPIRIGDLTG